MKRTATDDTLLENHQLKCRCCFKWILPQEKVYDVTKKVETQFLVLTQIEVSKKKYINKIMSYLICFSIVVKIIHNILKTNMCRLPYKVD